MPRTKQTEKLIEDGKATRFKTGAKQAETARRGGIASGKAKRKKKALAEMARAFADLKVNAEKNIVNGTVKLNNGDYQCGFKYDNSDTNTLFVEMMLNKKVSNSVTASHLLTTNTKFENEDIEVKVNNISGGKAEITVTVK